MQREITFPNGYKVTAEITEDSKNPGMLIARYKTNMKRVLRGKKWQATLQAALTQ